MSRTASIVGELNALFSEQLHIEVPGPEADLIDSGLLDSLQLVQLLLHIEQHLGVRIPLEEVALDDLRSVARLAGLITARTALPA